MQRAQNVCFWVIVRELRPIGYCVYKLQKKHKNEDVIFMDIDTSVENLWGCVQVGEMKAIRRLLWTNIPNHLHVMMVRSTMSKWKIMWLQMMRQSKFPWRIVKVPYFIPTRWRTGQCDIVGWSFKFMRSFEIWRCEQVGGHNAREVQLAHSQWYVGIDQPSQWS